MVVDVLVAVEDWVVEVGELVVGWRRIGGRGCGS